MENTATREIKGGQYRQRDRAGIERDVRLNRKIYRKGGGRERERDCVKPNGWWKTFMTNIDCRGECIE